MSKIKGNPYYCKLNKPSEKATKGRMVFKPAFGLQLGLFDEEQVKKAKELGLKIYDSNDTIPDKFLKFTSYVDEDNEDHLKTVPEGRRPKIYVGKEEVKNAPVMTSESEVNVIFDIAEFDGSKKALVRAVQITKLVALEGFEGVDISEELEDVGEVETKIVEKVDNELNDSLDDV